MLISENTKQNTNTIKPIQTGERFAHPVIKAKRKKINNIQAIIPITPMMDRSGVVGIGHTHGADRDNNAR